MATAKQQQSLEERIEKSSLTFRDKVEFYNSIKALESSDSKINVTLRQLSDKLFTDSLDAESVNYFNDLVSTIKALTIDYNKLGTMQRVSYLKMLGAKVDKKMSNDQLNKIYEELVK